MVTLTTSEIAKIGSTVSEILAQNHATECNEIKIVVDDESFLKIDEDLFYRNRKDDKQEFRPSDNQIVVNFPNVRIFIRKKSAETWEKN
jgi:hypothetical protein